MVRGWNDSGCRISVRFADSAEQRELRVCLFDQHSCCEHANALSQRAERTLKSGDQSPSRLTIAQAALLNLRGQTLQSDSHKTSMLPLHEDVPVISRRAPPQLPPRQCQTTLDCLPASRPLAAPTSLPTNPGQYSSPIRPIPDLHTTTDMNALIQSISSIGIGEGGLFDNILGGNVDYHTVPQTPLQTLTNARLLSGVLPIAPTHSQARNGFTPTEEMILQAHNRQLQLQTQFANTPHSFEQDILRADSSVPTVVGQTLTRNQAPPQNGSRLSGAAASNQFPLGRLRTSKSSPEFLPTISEDDAHVMSRETWHDAAHTSFGGYFPSSNGTAGVKTKPVTRGMTIAPPVCLDENVKGAK